MIGFSEEINRPNINWDEFRKFWKEQIENGHDVSQTHPQAEEAEGFVK